MNHGDRTGPRGVGPLMTSISSALAASTELMTSISEIEDVELRRLVTVLAERLKGTRLAFAELDRYFKRVYGQEE